MAAAPPPNDPSSSDPSSASIAASSSSQLAADRRVPGRQYQFFDPREDDDNPTGNAVPSPISSPLRLQGSIDRTEGSGDKRRRSDAEDDRSFVARVFNIPPPQIESGPPVETLHSVYNRGDDSETFPIAVPPVARSIIERCILAVFGITSPRPFQIFVIYCMVYLTKQLIYVIRKTGEGKTLVITTTAVLLRGIVIVMVPLIGLGSDQVNKAIDLGNGLEGYHTDENHGQDFTNLMTRLYSIKKRNGRAANAIILFCSPQSMGPGRQLTRALYGLAEKNLITAAFIDEAHTIHKDGYNGSQFRTEFDTGLVSLLDILKLQSTMVNIGMLSATLRVDYQATLTKLCGRNPNIVCWGGMARRNIRISVDISGCATAALRRCLVDIYDTNKDEKVVMQGYTVPARRSCHAIIYPTKRPRAEGISLPSCQIAPHKYPRVSIHQKCCGTFCNAPI